MTVCNAVNANGYRIFVCGTLTLNGTIYNDGSDGMASCVGDGAKAGTIGGGFDGGCEALLAQAAFFPTLGGMGGAGLNPGGALDPVTAVQGGLNVFNNVHSAVLGRTLDGYIVYGGTGGGSASTFVPGPAGGALVTVPVIGGGGGGGGVVGIYANKIVGNGTVSATGGNGYPGATTGGGGGGVIIEVVNDASQSNWTLDVSGGLPGPGGQAGQPGSIYIVPTYES
jgi:hypothetical protein